MFKKKAAGKTRTYDQGNEVKAPKALVPQPEEFEEPVEEVAPEEMPPPPQQVLSFELERGYIYFLNEDNDIQRMKVN